ncbi:MAG: DUF4331 domain-containing protein [Bryobacteraceae bacterium]|jgi:hypothetical protein
MKRTIHRLTSVAGAFSLLCGQMFASSHSDAPLSKQDPQTNLTDVYAFVTPGNTLTIVVNCRPFSEPGDGIMYDRFADDALYSINIANPVTGQLLVTYDFQFSPVSSAAGSYKNKGTAFSYGIGTAVGAIQTVGDSHQNFTQTYSVTAVNAATSSSTVLGSSFTVPPPNTGLRVTPHYNNASTGFAVSGATTSAALDTYTRESVFTAPTGELVFAGSREDSFFADAPGIFDLLDPRILGTDGHGQTGNGVDGFKGYNVLTFAIQIPLANLPAPIAYTDAFTGSSHGVGIYASVSRQRITLRSASGDNTNSGPWIQINRLGNPLFNEVLVAIQDKDNYNRDVPTNDAAKYAKYASTPELASNINLVFGTNFATSGRSDLVAVYIPDVLRVDTTTGAVPLIGEGGNRLSGLGGDLTNGKWSGWPNGRRLGDDVVDIALTATASGPKFSSIFLLGDNINANDQTYNFVFPYAATPNAGTKNSKDPVGSTGSTN